MVLVERNGRRSRGPSPTPNANGQNIAPDSSSDDDSNKKHSKTNKAKSEYEEKIRVGRDYQVQCPDYIPVSERDDDKVPDRALLVWSPTVDIPETKLEDYIAVAKERYGYNGEQALGMLFWHKHDLERAVLDLANFTPFPDEWSIEDKVLFEQAFQFHGKSFHRIRQMLPDKSIASLVKYYYSWKKSRSRTSVMDRQEKVKTKEGSAGSGAAGSPGSENGSENNSENDSDGEDKKWSMHRGIQRASGGSPNVAHSDDLHSGSQNLTLMPAASQSGDVVASSSGTATDACAGQQAAANTASGAVDKSATVSMKIADGSNPILNTSTSACMGCGVSCSVTNASPHGALCASCFHHWRRTGSMRPTSGPLQSRRHRSNGVERYKRKPPRGMYINHDDIVALASQDEELSTSASSNGNAGVTAGPPGTAAANEYRLDDPLNVLDREIAALLTKIQGNKQTLGHLRQRSGQVECVYALEAQPALMALRPHEAGTRINHRWNAEEQMLAVEGFRRFGRDYVKIAEVIGTKTEAHLRTFFVNYRRRYQLDALLKNFDLCQQKIQKKLEQKNGNGTTAAPRDSDEDLVMEPDSSQS